MKETIQVINEMQEAGLFRQYAIGGAVGATFYLEPVATFDIDIFISFENTGPLLSLAPIYEYLKNRGYHEEKERILIKNWPVQFLPPANPLVEEALNHATSTTAQGVPTRVMTAEHLVAIALQTGRGKDFARILQFIESAKLDVKKPMKFSSAMPCLPNGRTSTKDS